jgi:alkanesulfonate monooxygenase SsuD/methylene tetrahydromethanopterin reductase-like flavin-dependent oxidoreductase (luciferase family)
MIGARGPRAMRVIAEDADIWNCPWPSLEDFARQSLYLDQRRETVGRQPSDIVRLVQLIIRADDSAEPSASHSFFTALIDAGATHFVLGPVWGAVPRSGLWTS